MARSHHSRCWSLTFAAVLSARGGRAAHHLRLITPLTRTAMRQRTIDFLPFATSLWPSDLLAGTRRADVYLTSVSPPDEHGYCSLGSMLWASLDLVEAAQVVITE